LPIISGEIREIRPDIAAQGAFRKMNYIGTEIAGFLDEPADIVAVAFY